MLVRPCVWFLCQRIATVCLQVQVTLQAAVSDTFQVPPEVTGKTSQQAAVSDTFAALTKLAASDTAAFLNYQKRKQPSKLVVGRSATNKRLQSVVTTRKVDLFVFRLTPPKHCCR